MDYYLYLQVSPDENPVLDRHPQFSNIIIGAGFSGVLFNIIRVAVAAIESM